MVLAPAAIRRRQALAGVGMEERKGALREPCDVAGGLRRSRVGAAGTNAPSGGGGADAEESPAVQTCRVPIVHAVVPPKDSRQRCRHPEQIE